VIAAAGYGFLNNGGGFISGKAVCTFATIVGINPATGQTTPDEKTVNAILRTLRRRCEKERSAQSKRR